MLPGDPAWCFTAKSSVSTGELIPGGLYLDYARLTPGHEELKHTKGLGVRDLQKAPFVASLLLLVRPGAPNVASCS